LDIAGEGLYRIGPHEEHLARYKTDSIAASELNPIKVRDFVRSKQVFRILGKIPTIAANAFRHREGRPYNHPMQNPSSITEGFLYLIDKLNEEDYRPDPRLVTLLDKAFILLAEHGSCCSTITMRHLVSSGVDLYTAVSGACGALFGERKAGEVERMLLEDVRNVTNIATYLETVKSQSQNSKAKSGTKDRPTARLMGFGSRPYKKSLDPRVKLMKDLVLSCFQHIHEKNPHEPSNHLVYLALQFESKVAQDPYFSSRNLNSNIDYWAAILFHTMGFPRDMFPVLLAIPRSAGYLAHALESFDDKEFKIFRPRQVYEGLDLQPYVEVASRKVGGRNLEAMSNRSNPVASLRRSLLEVSGLTEVNHLITSTKKNIVQLAQLLSSKMIHAEGRPGLPKNADWDTTMDWVQNVSEVDASQGSPGCEETAGRARIRSELMELLEGYRELVNVRNFLERKE
jgi:citrate synthase